MHALDALGSPVRRDILRELQVAPLTVGELAMRFPVSRPAISRHLQVLREAGLVEVRPQRGRGVYAIRVQGFASVRDFLDEFWDTALARFTGEASRWWPPQRRHTGDPSSEITLAATGAFFERAADGTTVDLGRV